MASEYRLKRGPVIVVLAVVAVLGVLLIGRSSVKPQVDVYGAITVPDAYDGTTYAFDGLVCLRASSIGARIGGSADGGDTRIGLRPDGAPVTIAYPVRMGDIRPLSGTQVSAGDQQCTRVLVTPHGAGQRRAGAVRVSFRYGPFGLLRSTATVVPPVTLQVTGTGTDPRTGA